MTKKHIQNKKEFYPELVITKGLSFSIEIDIQYIPKKYEGEWTTEVIKITKSWLRNNEFTSKGTIWMWTTSSVNFQHDRPTFSEFIIPLGFPKQFFSFLVENLKKALGERLVRISDMVRFVDGWQTLCHIEGNKVWREVEQCHYEQV